jgi:hypothetical protein
MAVTENLLLSRREILEGLSRQGLSGSSLRKACRQFMDYQVRRLFLGGSL